MLTKIDMVDGGLMLFGLTISLADIQATLSIVIIVIDILWIIGKFVIRFFRFISDGKIDPEEAEQLKSQVDTLKDYVDKLDKDGDEDE